MSKLRNFFQRVFSFFLVFFLSGCAQTAGGVTIETPSGNNPHVLLLSSYGYSWDSVPLLLSGVSTVLDRHANIDYVFMDTKVKAYNDIKEKVKEEIVYYVDHAGAFDFVLAADDDALTFVLEYQETLFKNIPIVFEGINNAILAETAVRNPYITGIIEDSPINDTIKLAKKINPKAKKVVGISDTGISGVGYSHQFLNCQENFPEMPFTVINSDEGELTDFGEKIASYTDDTILLFMSMNKDSYGNNYSLSEGVSFVYRHAQIPIYKADELGVGKGIMGGVTINFGHMASDAAQIILELSAGADISSYTLKNAPYYCVFDKHIMDEFSISIDKINESYEGEVTYLNNPISFFAANKGVIIPVIIIIFLLIVLLILSLVLLFKTRKTTKTIEEKDKNLNDILDNIPGGVIAFRYHIYTKKIEMFYNNQGFLKSLPGGINEAEDLKSRIEISDYRSLLDLTPASVLDNIDHKLEKGENFKAVCKSTVFSAFSITEFSAVMTKKEDDCYVYYAVISDITNETKLQEKEKKAFELEASNKAKSDFLSVVSHDMRTPLNGIIGLAALMKGETSDIDLLSDISKLQVSADYLLTLVNDTLDMSKIDNGSFALHPIVCSSKEIFDSLKIVLQSSLDKKKMSIDFKVEKPAELVLFADRQRMTQVYMNIITNAIKYSKDGSSILVHVKRLEVGENYVRDETQVIDHGIGMSKEFITHVFDPFSQERKNTAKQYEGTGLGMSITKKIVEKMHGKIKVESQLDVGTTVTFDLVLPIASKEQIKMTEEKSKETSSLLLLKGKRALIVDDQSLNAEIVKRLLDKQGIVSDIAYNGKEGLDKFSSSKPNTYDFILMDIRMPVMDGFEATEKIRALKRKDASKIKIIALTANAFYEDYQASKAISFDGYLAKPINPDDLLTMLISLLGL